MSQPSRNWTDLSYGHDTGALCSLSTKEPPKYYGLGPMSTGFGACKGVPAGGSAFFA